MHKNYQSFIIALFLLFYHDFCRAQFSFYTIDEQHINEHRTDCTPPIKTMASTANPFAGNASIAITPNGVIYGLDENRLFRFDQSNGNIIPIGDLFTREGNLLLGNCLVGLNNTTLLTLHEDTLYSLNINQAATTPIGKVGFFSGGDLAFYKGDLYLTSRTGTLIKIELSNDYRSILAVTEIGKLDIEAAFSICTIYDDCDTKSLYVINGQGKLYRVNPDNADSEFICDFRTTIYDAASFHDFVLPASVYEKVSYPNFFSPNADGKNDVYEVTDLFPFKSFTIYDRWGKKVYQIHSDFVSWDGTTLNGEQSRSGVYYFTAEFEEEFDQLLSPDNANPNLECPYSGSIGKTGSITLIR